MMLNIQLSARQCKRGRSHLPELLIHVLEAQPAAGATSPVRAPGGEEAVPATLYHPTRYLQNPGTAVPSCSTAPGHAKGVVLVPNAQGWPLHKGTWMFPPTASSRTQPIPCAPQPHTQHFPTFSLLTRDGESCSAETKMTPA